MDKRYGFLHTEYIDGEKDRVYKPIMVDSLEKAKDMYNYFDNRNKQNIIDGFKANHEIAIFDYEKMIYVNNNFRLFRRGE